MDVKPLTVNGWTLSVCERPTHVPHQAIDSARTLIAAWQSVAALEPTWAQQQYGVPTILLRIDATLDKFGALHTYEVEERPAGLGITSKAFPTLRQARDEWLRSLPPLAFVVSPCRTKGTDDSLWLDKFDMAKALKNEQLVFVRAEPSEVEFHCLQPISASSVVHKGDKSYGCKLGLWREVAAMAGMDETTTASLFPWDKPFVFKGDGSKLKEVYLWNPDSRARKRTGGFSTRSQILRALQRLGRGYVQPYHAPMEIVDGETIYYQMLRIFFGYYPQHNCYQLLGGAWCARPNNVLIHGTPETVMGPLTF